MRVFDDKDVDKNCLLYPNLPTFNAPTQNFFQHFWKIKLFLPHFHQKITTLPLWSNERKKKKYEKTFFPLPSYQKIQGRGTANKQFFKDGLIKG